MPRLMMSTPRAMAFCFISSIAANRYGAKVLIRLEGSIGNPAMKRRSFRTAYHPHPHPPPSSGRETFFPPSMEGKGRVRGVLAKASIRVLHGMRKRKGVLTRPDLRDSVGHARPCSLLSAARLDAQRVRRPGCAGRSDRPPDRS